MKAARFIQWILSIQIHLSRTVYNLFFLFYFFFFFYSLVTSVAVKFETLSSARGKRWKIRSILRGLEFRINQFCDKHCQTPRVKRAPLCLWCIVSLSNEVSRFLADIFHRTTMRDRKNREGFFRRRSFNLLRWNATRVAHVRKYLAQNCDIFSVCKYIEIQQNK